MSASSCAAISCLVCPEHIKVQLQTRRGLKQTYDQVPDKQGDQFNMAMCFW